MTPESKLNLSSFFGIGLIFPLFFQLSGHIYNSSTTLLDSGGKLATLPLPLSILVCFGGILVWIKNYKSTYFGWIFITIFCAVMSISLCASSISVGFELRKALLMLQFLLPTFGLIAGLLIEDNDKSIAKSFLYTLLFLVPLQLICGWMQDTITLTHNLYLFGIYSHIEYVPPILVCAFAYTLSLLWDSHKRRLSILTLLMLIYVVSSTSFLTIFAYFSFIIVFSCSKIYGNWQQSQRRFILPILSLMTVAVIIFYLPTAYNKLGNLTHHNSLTSENLSTKYTDLYNGKIPSNIQERLDIWKLYTDGMTDNTAILLLGHPAPLPREIRSSAHNWYLDLIYNFGIIALLPILFLILFTTHQYLRSKRKVGSDTFWLAVIVFFLVIIDNNFKVTLRQPYPGIFAFFMWGLLLSNLRVNHDQTPSSTVYR
ncbi:hypothetical protein [Methylomonas sp. AM2-LC]|uniref:hypothetical protein n=1 Tax=Methylomonas sp. AM2-LC TaxID=3153301 RepID=UPI0032670192